MVTALQAVIRTMRTDIEGSSQRLRRLLEPEHVARFGHEELSWLAREIGTIAQVDPALAIAIYETAFGFEDPDGTTPVRLGNSQILGLTANRRQNYQQAWWGLGEALPGLLRDHLDVGVRAVSRAIGGYVQRAYPPLDEPSQSGEVPYGDRPAHYQPDRSFQWYRGGFVRPQDGPALFQKFDEYLTRIAGEPDGADKVAAIIETLKTETGHAVFWASLLLVAAKHPELASLMIPLATSPLVMIGWDTRHPLGQFFAAVYGALDPGQRSEIERSLLALTGKAGEDAKKRLAGTIPPNLVTTDAMRAYLADLVESGEARPNTPVVQITTSTRPYDTDAYLATEGVRVDAPANAAVRDALRAVETLPKLTMVDELDVDQARMRIAALKALSGQVAGADRDVVDAKLISLAEGTLAEHTAAIARLNPGVLADGQVWRRLADLLLACAASTNPVPSAEVEARFDDDGVWGGPSARTSAADGLIRLAGVRLAPDADVAAAVRALARDPVCHVRLHIVQHLNFLAAGDLAPWMWEELAVVIASEPTRGVVGGALEAVSALSRIDIGRTITLAKAVLQRYLNDASPGAASCRTAAMTFIAQLHVWDINAEADAFFESCLQPASLDTVLISTWVCQFSANLLVGSLVDPNDPQHGVRQKTLAFYARALDAADAIIAEIDAGRGLGTFGQWSESDQARVRAAFDVVDEVALRLSFALGAHAQNTAPEAQPVAERVRLYAEAKPLLDRLADAPIANIAHNLIQGLEVVIDVDPSGVFAVIARTIRAAARGGYGSESLAVPLIIGIVERYLAEHRDVFADPDRLKDLIDSLDVFARAGWPEAQALTFRVADIWR